ncbi:MAG: hypothetical protein AB2807_01735 [Candidatus Sedimenticola endophacoides]
MAKQRLPATQAVLVLKAARLAFDSHPYGYQERGGTAQFAREMGIDEHLVIKTLILEDEGGSRW